MSNVTDVHQGATRPAVEPGVGPGVEPGTGARIELGGDTDVMPTGPAPRTRRSILFAAAGAVAGAVGSSLVRPEAAAAANGSPVVLGQANGATAQTSVSASLTSADSTMQSAVKVQASGTARRAIEARITADDGAAGDFFNDGARGAAVRARASAISTAGIGVDGVSNAQSGIGIRGTSGAHVGVVGISKSPTNGTPAAPPANTGVYGWCPTDAGSIGVMGEAAAGLGIKGKSTAGSGVYGTSQTGFGVIAHSASGTAGHFSTSGALVGTALHTVGRVRFDKSVGLATIVAGTKNVVVTPGIDVTATSAVVATLQGAAGATLSHIVVDATNNRFTIHLTKNATVSVKVAWHVFG
jgi:hypothetical protein